MNRKVAVPKLISKYIGQCKLPRSVVVILFTRIHNEIAASYNYYRNFRSHQDEGRSYIQPFSIKDGGIRHLFTLTIDDTTSGEHLIINSIRHDTDE